jgi:hypothetical protein
MQSPNPNAIPKASENTDLARTAMVVRRANTRNGTTAIRNWTIPLPRQEKRRVAGRNAKTVILTADESGNDRKPKLATMTTTKARRNGKALSVKVREIKKQRTI